MTRRHDRQAVGGPVAGVLVTGAFGWLVLSSGGMPWKIAASAAFVLAVAWLLLDLGRWRDRISVYEGGLVQVQRGRRAAYGWDDLTWMEFSAAGRGALLDLLLPLPISLLLHLRGLGKTFRLRIHVASRAMRPVRLNAAFISGGDDINTIVDRVGHRMSAGMMRSLHAGEAVQWTPRLLLTPDGLVRLRRPMRDGREAIIRTFVPYADIRTAEVRHGHLLVRVHGRSRCIINSRSAGRAPAGWRCLREMMTRAGRPAGAGRPER